MDFLGAGVESARLLLGRMPDVAVIVDRDGRILYTNREPPGEDLTGTSVFDHDLGGGAEARMRAALHQVFSVGKPISYEVETKDPEDGGSIWYVSRWSPIEHDGQVVAGLVVSSDITRRVTLERADWQEVILESAAEGIVGLERRRARLVRELRRERPARRPAGRAHGPQHP